MAAIEWIKRQNRFSLPKGIKFDLATRRFYIEQPTEHRPLYDRLLAGESLPLIVIHDGVYVRIKLVSESGDRSIAGPTERLTQDEWINLNSNQQYNEISNNSDMIIAEPGPLIGFNLSPKRTAILDNGERGLILHCGIRECGKDLEIRTGFEPEELRAALLLWDKLDWPSHNQVYTVPNEDCQFLIEEGLMIRTPFSTIGSLISRNIVTNLHNQAFDLAEKVEPSRWSIASGSLSTPNDNEAIKNEAILASLNRAIVVPDREVPLEDVLRFKEHRRAELLALRHYLDDVYAKIRAAHDQPRAWASELEKLDLAVTEQIRVAKEAGWRRLLKSIGSEFSVEPVAGIAAGMTSFAANNNISVALTTGIGTALTVKASRVFQYRDAPENSLRYVFSLHKFL